MQEKYASTCKIQGKPLDMIGKKIMQYPVLYLMSSTLTSTLIL